jgi:hypothetical protein
VTAHTEHRGRPARDCGSPRPLRDGASTRVRGLRQRNRRVHSSCYSPQVSRWHTAAGTTPTGSPPGRTRLRAPDRGSSERRRRRRGWPVWGLGPASYGGGAAGTRTRPAPRSAPLPHGAGPRSTERRGPLTRRQAMGRDRRPAVWLHMQGSAPGSVAAIIGQRGALANPARDCGRTRGPCRGRPPDPRITWGFDVTPIHAGDTRPYRGFTWFKWQTDPPWPKSFICSCSW